MARVAALLRGINVGGHRKVPMARLREGNMKPIGVIVGFVMRETKGRADGGEITRIVHEQLGL